MKSKATGLQYISNNGGEFSLATKVVKDKAGKIISGLLVGPTLEQNMASILIAKPGDFKLHLQLGVGIRSALLDEELLSYRHAIKQHFAYDGLIVNHLDLYNLQNFSIDAEYE